MWKKRTAASPPRELGEQAKKQARLTATASLFEGGLGGPAWAKVVQDIAHADGAVSSMAPLAARTRLTPGSRRNILRNMRRFALKGTKYPAPWTLPDVPFTDPKTGQDIFMGFPMLLPHQ
eukprot:4715864-Amphidinium_carterae.1